MEKATVRVVNGESRYVVLTLVVRALDHVTVSADRFGERALDKVPLARISVRAPVVRAAIEPAARLGLMPDLRGMSARTAVNSLNRLGLTPKLSGHGFVVEQSPEPGSTLVRGDVARIKLARRMPALLPPSPQQ